MIAALLIAAVLAQSPRFEVAVIHPINGASEMLSRDSVKANFIIEGNRVTDQPVTVMDLMRDAWQVRNFQIIGLPKWAVTFGTVYDVTAKAPGASSPSVPEVRLMLQALLTDRFQLKLHKETREIPVYELVLARPGTKLKVTSRIGLSFENLLVYLADFLDRPIVDKTGLAGTVQQIDLAWLDNERDQGLPVSFHEIEQRLGLKLLPAVSIETVLVVDRVERPSEN